MGGRTGIVYSITGNPGQGNDRQMGGGVVMSGGSSAYCDVVFDHGGFAKRVPEGIVLGPQWRLLDKPPATSNEIQEALDFAEAEKKRAEEEAAAEKRQFEEEVAQLRESEDWTYLEQQDPQNPTYGSKLAAKNIRKFLKKNYPKVKFSVRVQDHDCVLVRWDKEDSTEEVNQTSLRDALRMFRTGYYDMTSDCHLSKGSPFNVVFGGAEYMTVQEN
jgi:hypothetical protein